MENNFAQKNAAILYACDMKLHRQDEQWFSMLRREVPGTQGLLLRIA